MLTPADLERSPLFAVLAPSHLARIAARAADIRANAGEWIVHDGDPPFFWAMLDGEVEGIRVVANQELQVTTFDPGEYFGEVPLMLGASAFVAIRALRPSRLARIDPGDFFTMVNDCPEAGAMLAKSLIRRVGVIGENYAALEKTQATIVGDRYDFACHDLRDFLSRNQIAFDWLDLANESDAPFIPEAARRSGTYPVVMFPDGSSLVAPGARDLARKLDLQIEPAAECYDVVIIGGGPAGLAAAVYGGSEGLHTMLVEREAPGGQAGTSSRIENYLGFPGGISGGDLAARALQQAKRFGTELLVTRDVRAIVPDEAEGHLLELDGGSRLRARAIVLATGVAWRKLAADGADRLVGRGVYYGAARTEALGARGKDIVLVGGGNSAGQAAMFFANYARSVTLLVRGDSLERSMSYYLIEQLRSKSNVAVETATTILAVGGETHLERITTRDERTQSARERPIDAAFCFIGADAQTSWLPAAIERDERGYIRTGAAVAGWHLERTPYMLETSVPGIFAAGDVRSASIKRVASGVGEGSIVISYIHDYLTERRALEVEHTRTRSSDVVLTS